MTTPMIDASWRAAIIGILCMLQLSSLHAGMVRYTMTDPGQGWQAVSFDDAGWATATDLAEVSQRWKSGREANLWVRFHQTLVWEQINNSYFRVAHDGEMEIFINGKAKEHDKNPATKPKDYPVSPDRSDKVGDNVYALHFTRGNTGEVSIEHVIGEWVTVDEKRIVKSNPVIKELTRDSEACLGGDGAFYLTATASTDPDFFHGPRHWMISPGIKLWRSTDLKKWDSLDYVWQFERDGTWNKEFGSIDNRSPARAIFAPEIKFFNNQYWLVYSVNHKTATHTYGIGLLHADKPAGPYTEVSPDKPISEGFDPSLFQDDDGKVYLLRNRSLIARMKDDMSGVAEPFRQIATANFPSVGYEGPQIFKYKGRYYLVTADAILHRDGQSNYSAMIASSDHVYGPYGPRYEALRYGGHNSFFQDAKGQWYATVWKIPDSDLQITIPRMEWSPAGLFQPMLEDCLKPGEAAPKPTPTPP